MYRCGFTSRYVDLKPLTVYSMCFGILYWYVWTVLLPKWKGYALEEEVHTLDDGTPVTRLVKVPREQVKGRIS